jgi:hypothetical protein
MIKLIAFIPRRPDITIERFHVHWRYPHGEMASEVELFKRYLQGHRVAAIDPDLGATEFDGTAEIWFDDLEAALSQPDDPVYAERVGPDEANFIDLDKLAYLYLHEEVLVPGPELAADSPGFKLVQGVRRADGTSPEDFAERWVAAAPGLAERLGADRHVCCVTLPYHHENGTAIFDGVRELRWPDRDSLERARLGGAWRELAAQDAIDPAGSSSMVVEEFRVVWPGSERRR